MNKITFKKYPAPKKDVRWVSRDKLHYLMMDGKRIKNAYIVDMSWETEVGETDYDFIIYFNNKRIGAFKTLSIAKETLVRLYNSHYA